ncbi:MAG TPA: hypothetical protein VF950_12175 [Planctomycetota bacterium]
MATATRFPQEGRHVRLSPDASKAAWTSDAGLHIAGRLALPDTLVEDLAWAPDASGVAVVLADRVPGGQRRIRWVPEYVGDESYSSSGASFAWEGIRLIVADPWTGELRRHCTETGRQDRVCALRDHGDPLRAPALAVAPDGRRLAFSATLEDRAEIRIVDLPSGEPRLLTELPKASIRAVPFWTPDSRSLGVLMVDLESGASGLVLVKDLEGEGEILHASELLLPPSRPAFSPSGKRLAFLDVERPHHEFTKAGHPRLAILEGGVRRAITAPGEVDGDLRWLAEDRLVVDGGPAAWTVSA